MKGFYSKIKLSNNIGNFLVLHSNKQSLKNKEISFLAIIEIILSIGIYWYIAVYFNTYFHIILSIVIAPIFLLTSKKSRKYNISLLNKWSKASYKNIKPEQRGYMILITILVSFILTQFFIKLDINSILIYFMISIVSSTILLIFAGKDVDVIPFLQRSHISMSIGMAVAFLLMHSWYSAIIVLLIAAIVAQVERFWDAHFMLVGFIFLNPINLMLSAVFTTYFYAIYSIVRTKSSFNIIIDNWKSSLFMTDMTIYPELIPGIEETSIENLKFSCFWKMKNILLLPMFMFPIIYRISIKSTIWFYLPLLYIVKKPNLNNSAEIGKFLSELYQTVWAKVRVFLALGTIIAFILTYFKYYAFSEVSNIPFIAVVSMLYLDFSSIEIWKIFQLLVAILTISLFLYANAVRVPSVANNIPIQKDYKIMSIYYLNSIRNWISFLYLISTFIFLIYYFKIWEYSYFPPFTEDVLSNLVEYIRYKPFG